MSSNVDIRLLLYGCWALLNSAQQTEACTHVMLANDWVAISHLFKCCSDSNYLIVGFDYYTVCPKQKRADASTGCYLHSNTTATEWVGRKYGLCQCREWRQMTHSTWIAAADRKNRKVKKGKVITDDDVTSEQSHTGKKSACSLWEQRKRKLCIRCLKTQHNQLLFSQL